DRRTIPIKVDKSHITTLGERLYIESIELIRELVNNAYDADATEVRVTVQPDMIKVEDNGTGMDWPGLEQYFNIGSPEKLLHSGSPVFKRDRIGQFGIGKFASLAACDRFEVYTQKEDFAAKVIFDKESWSKSEDIWELPIEEMKPDKARGDGTAVILSKLNRKFDPDMVRQKIIESVPIQAQNFSVFINDRKVVMARVPGHRIPFLEGTDFGPVYGEIVIVPVTQASASDMGIQIRVKGVMVKKEYFGIQTWGREGARIRGEVNADFLPITSDRSGFRTDTPEYQAFQAVMVKIIEQVRKQLNRISDQRETKKVKRALKEALERIQQALERHSEFVDAGFIPKGEETNGVGEPAELSPTREPSADEEEVNEPPDSETEPEIASETEDQVSDEHEEYQEKPAKRPMVKRLTPSAVVRKLQAGDLLVSCCLDHFGEDGPECFTQGQVIYINRDHPLYQRESKQKATHTMYLARLLTQEIALMKSPPDPRTAFQRQSELLRDAFSE
ncbi:ATP-binding protein, partial [candidate division KSB1 bacterium]|nr:ATP-binding protein [candidate division KSB1 bacterium]NIR68561.1 ATP-binding protein [candidate division KSB1 bacterium]NIS23965.1 ATP-binding protein [candidate division KSB1 bacterium]NIT70888.1 ATP-binding protein [candidate division KSB1 bacterium]NIU24618.1 ATP-binding protein [candidate division KSB1 bacterium]